MMLEGDRERSLANTCNPNIIGEQVVVCDIDDSKMYVSRAGMQSGVALASVPNSP